VNGSSLFLPTLLKREFRRNKNFGTDKKKMSSIKNFPGKLLMKLFISLAHPFIKKRAKNPSACCGEGSPQEQGIQNDTEHMYYN
jgi:hypothetical protein